MVDFTKKEMCTPCRCKSLRTVHRHKLLQLAQELQQTEDLASVHHCLIQTQQWGDIVCLHFLHGGVVPVRQPGTILNDLVQLVSAIGLAQELIHTSNIHIHCNKIAKCAAELHGLKGYTQYIAGSS